VCHKKKQMISFKHQNPRKKVLKKALDSSKERVTKSNPDKTIEKQPLNAFKSTILKFTIIPIIPLTILAYFSNNPNAWIIGGLDHFYFEMFAVVLSFIAAYYCIWRGYALKDKLSLFIGLGFHVAGIIDLLHGVFAILNLGQTSFEAYFIPQTWVAGRIVMGAVMMIGLAKFRTNSKFGDPGEDSIQKTILMYTGSLAVLAASVTVTSLIQPFPFVTIDFIINRPYEIIGAIFYGIALIYFFKNRLYRLKDAFYKGIMIILLVDIFVNVIASYSTFVFDTSFNVAHVLKNVSYFVFVLALVSSFVYHYKQKDEMTEELKSIDRSKEEFLSMVTHELKTPLTPIMGWCEVMKNPKIVGELSDKQNHAIEMIYSNSKNNLTN